MQTLSCCSETGEEIALASAPEWADVVTFPLYRDGTPTALFRVDYGERGEEVLIRVVNLHQGVCRRGDVISVRVPRRG